MKLYSSSIVFVLVLILCNNPTNTVKPKNDFSVIYTEICNKDHTSEVMAEVNRCAELDPYFKLQVS